MDATDFDVEGLSFENDKDREAVVVGNGFPRGSGSKIDNTDKSYDDEGGVSRFQWIPLKRLL